MTDLEKNNDLTENTEGTVTSNGGDNFDLNFSDSLPQEPVQNETNLSGESPVSMEANPSESVQTPDINSPTESQNDKPTEGENIDSQQPSENIFAEDSTEIQTPDSLSESNTQPDLSNMQPDLSNMQQEVASNEAPLGKIEDETNATAINEESQNVSTNSIDTPAPIQQPNLAENPLLDNNPQDQGKNKSTAKEKLAQLIKVHESKAQKSGFIKGILSGVALTIVIVLAGFIFAKDQILNLISTIDGDNSSLSASVLNVTDTNDEEITAEDEIVTEDEEFIEDEESMDEDIYNEDDITNEGPMPEELMPDEEIDSDNYEDYDVNEEIYDEEDEELSDSSYTISYVDSEEEANWVLPAHCSDLTCYGEDKEFVPCSKFKLDANLGENSQRILKNGACKYKDPSELVYVEFN